MFIAEELIKIEEEKPLLNLETVPVTIPLMRVGKDNSIRNNKNNRIYPYEAIKAAMEDNAIVIPPAPPIMNHVLSQDEVEDLGALYSPATEKARDIISAAFGEGLFKGELFRGYRPRFIGEKY